MELKQNNSNNDHSLCTLLSKTDLSKETLWDVTGSSLQNGKSISWEAKAIHCWLTRSLMNKPTCSKCNYHWKEWSEMFYGFCMRFQIKGATTIHHLCYLKSEFQVPSKKSKGMEKIHHSLEDFYILLKAYDSAEKTQKFPSKADRSFFLIRHNAVNTREFKE